MRAIRDLQPKSVFLVVAAIFLLSCGSVCHAKNDEPTVAQLLTRALNAMQSKRYDAAVENMYIYLDAVSASQNPRVILIAQDIRFKLASILLAELKRPEEAVSVLQDYVDQPYGNQRRLVMKLLANTQYELSDLEGVVKTVNAALLYNKNPELNKPVQVVVVPEDDKGKRKRKDDDEKEDLDELEKALAELEPEPEYTQKELNSLYMLLGESLFGLGQWEECVEPFTYVIEHEKNEQTKGYAIMQIINALIEIPDFERIQDWIPQLYRTTARFDIRVNLALMNAASALYEQKMYDSALPLYRMILPRETLINYHKGRLRELRINAGLPPEENMQVTEAEMLLFGVSDNRETETEARDADTGLLEEKPKELIELENLLIALENLPPYEDHVLYHMALIYREVGRFWEAVTFYDAVYKRVPDDEVGQYSVYGLIEVYLNELGEEQIALQRAFDYMSKYKEGMIPRQVAFTLTAYFQRQDKLAEVKVLLPYIDGFVRTSDETIRRFDAELYYMQAVADLIMRNYEVAEASFKRVLDEFPGSHQEGNSFYWHGMTKLFQQKYVEGYAIFEEYIQRFADEDWLDEAYYQGGVCLFGQEKYEDALQRFTYMITTYPDSSVFPEACSMRGDIYGSRGQLDEAVADYKTAIQHAKKVNQATYAVFQMTTVFESEERYGEIVREVNAYLDTWDKEADIAKALFWIGKTNIQQGRIDEAVETYVNAIVKFGGDVLQDGVDLMITELVKISAMWLNDTSRDRLKGDLNVALKNAVDVTLQLRLRATLAKLGNTEVELGKQLLKELPDLDNAPPPVLGVICEASFEMEDYSRSEELLRTFSFKFPESEFMRSAFRLRASGQYAERDYEGALETVKETQELYGTEYDVAWAQLMKAQILLDQNKFEEASEANKAILSVRAWRGAPVAQATYQLGQVEEKLGKLRNAFGFYQRTYFQYKGLANGFWAAEAYLASARCLQGMGRRNDVRNTYRAMLFDPYVNLLPQADIARRALGPQVVSEIEAWIAQGNTTNIAITVEAEEVE